VLATVHGQAATQVFERDCLVMLGTCVAPVGRPKGDAPVATLHLELPDGPRRVELAQGALLRIPLPTGSTARCRIEPARGVDIGAGPGAALETQLDGGEVGLLLDGRGRPLRMPADAAERVAAIERWIADLDLYPRRGGEPADRAQPALA
jgi:hypothetical protein